MGDPLMADRAATEQTRTESPVAGGAIEVRLDEGVGKTEFFDDALFAMVAEQARRSPRLRMNYNFHRTTDDPVNRLLNVMHRGSYLPVHRHLEPARSETSVVMRGSVGVTVYDGQGCVVARRRVSASGPCCGFDIEAGVWHGLVVLEDDTVLFEVKQGPYAPIAAENVAPWTPDADDEAAVAEFIKNLETEFNKLKDE